jgi:hypothetical protein
MTEHETSQLGMEKLPNCYSVARSGLLDVSHSITIIWYANIVDVGMK